MSVDPQSALWLSVVVIHLASTWFLVGLIWMIQVVHYPGFSLVDSAKYATFQKAHMQAMGRLIGLPWLLEGLTVLGLFILAPDSRFRLIATVGGVLEAVIIGVTVFSSVRAHVGLEAGFSAAHHNQLLRSNWIRTWAWTARGIVAIIVLALTWSA